MLFQSSVLCTSLGLLKMSRDTKREKQRGSGERKRKKNEGRNTHTLTHSSSFTVGRYGCLASLRCSNRIVDCRSYSKRSLLRRSVAVYRAGHNHKECLAVVRAFCRSNSRCNKEEGKQRAAKQDGVSPQPLHGLSVCRFPFSVLDSCSRLIIRMALSELARNEYPGSI